MVWIDLNKNTYNHRIILTIIISISVIHLLFLVNNIVQITLMFIEKF